MSCYKNKSINPVQTLDEFNLKFLLFVNFFKSTRVYITKEVTKFLANLVHLVAQISRPLVHLVPGASHLLHPPAYLPLNLTVMPTNSVNIDGVGGPSSSRAGCIEFKLICLFYVFLNELTFSCCSSSRSRSNRSRSRSRSGSWSSKGCEG